MSDKNEENGKNTLSLKPKKLELKKVVSAGQVRQSFSHGRSKTVEVEVKKKRRTISKEQLASTTTTNEESAPEPSKKPISQSAEQSLPAETDKEEDTKSQAIPHGLTKEEWEARIRVVKAAKKRQDEEAASDHNEQPTGRTRVEVVHEAPQPLKKKEEKTEPKPEQKIEESATDADAETGQQKSVPTPTPTSSHKPPVKGKDATETEERSRRQAEASRSAKPRRTEPKRREGKLTLQQALVAGESGDSSGRVRSEAALRRAREKEKQKAAAASQPTQKIVREVVIPETLTVQELSNRMAVRVVDVIKSLMKMGMMVTINQVIDADTAELVVEEFGHTSKRVSEADVESTLQKIEDSPESLKPRAPVVTIMGHVDHGKTSLLDALRQTDVVAKEAGGITQHIGAYKVRLQSDQEITFIDTPGHAAFTAMRARGAQVTDIVILVVAADDGIKEQTVEAINHIKAAGVPMIVAINKIDKPGADPDRVRQELLSHELVVEELGGDVISVEVSAKKKQNLDKLEENILLIAEMHELKANPDRSGQGMVVEAKMEQGRGAIATILVQSGTINIGDIFVTGCEWGRVRALLDDHGKSIKQAGPATPVEVLGLNGIPDAGDDFAVVANEAQARDISEYRRRKSKAQQSAARQPATLEDIFASTSEQEKKRLAVVIKGDVQGSVEAISNSLTKIVNDEVEVSVLHTGVGGITESDVSLAHASNGLIIGFNVRANPQARDCASRDKVPIQYYSVIYDVIDEVKSALSGLLSPGIRETALGRAEIREVFDVSKVGKIAGCMVTEGLVKRGAKVRLLRDDVVIHTGDLKTLKRFKDDVKEVREGSECGIAFENFQDIREGDTIECFEAEEVARTV
ncbi:MAG: translation initiation factor IF-2 [Pseudomonadota bacterium]